MTNEEKIQNYLSLIERLRSEKYRCAACKQLEPKEEFYNSKRDGVSSRCKLCDKKRDRKEYMHEYSKTYRDKQKAKKEVPAEQL